MIFFFFKQKTAYEMRISDWSSDVCSSDLKQIPIRTVSNRSGGAGWPRSCGLNTFGQAGFMAGNPPTLPMTQGYDAPYRFLVNRMAFVALGLGVFFSSFNTWRVSEQNITLSDVMFMIAALNQIGRAQGREKRGHDG